MILPEAITPGDRTHIDDHKTIAKRFNRFAVFFGNLQADVDNYNIVILPPGNIEYSETLLIPDGGMHLYGMNTTLRYTGSGAAIAKAFNFTNGYSKLTLSGINLIGNESATSGVDLTGASIYSPILRDVNITGFEIGLILNNVYSGVCQNVNILGCQDAIKASGVCQAITLRDCWLSNFSRYGIDLSSIGDFIISGGIIDAAALSNPLGQCAIYQTATEPRTRLSLRGVHFEDVYQILNLTAGRLYSAPDVFYGSHEIDNYLGEAVVVL